MATSERRTRPPSTTTVLTVHAPEIAAQWHPTKNRHSSDYYSFGSDKKAWWICDLGHEWEAVIKSRVNGRGCPFCSNKAVLIGFNDLLTRYPVIALEFDEARNGKRASEVVAGGKTSYWWRCQRCDYSWQQNLNNRLANGSNCPACYGKKVIAGFSDMETRCPELLDEFDYSKNKQAPSAIHYRSRYAFWWKCKGQGHEWKTTVNARVRDGHGCPGCSLKSTSAIERIVREGLATMPHFSYVSDDHLESVKVKARPPRKRDSMQVDALCILHDGKKLVVNYDGSRWHFGEEAVDLLNTKLLLEAGYAVIRIREQSRRFALSHLDLAHPNFYQISYAYVSSWHKGAPELMKELDSLIKKI